MEQGSTIDLGQRRLAAIMFTDIVSFSRRTQENETETLRLVKRDTQFIKNTCAEFNGRMLKSTGDGLLLFFDSAVDAVAAALTIQEKMNGLKARNWSNEVLEHRIGIHLGDVYMQEDDVMGDGVNIAARLQKEAQPGGICISQTVYEVVKNKLGIKVVSLGPRELKNIREAVPAYQVLLEAQKVLHPTTHAGRRRRLTLSRKVAVSGSILLVTALAGGGLWYRHWKESADANLVLPGQVMPPTPPPGSADIPSTPVAESPPPQDLPGASPSTVPPASADAPPPEAGAKYNGGPPHAPPACALQRAIPWIEEQMMSFSQSHPVPIVAPPRLAEAATNLPPSTAWMESNVLHFKNGGKDTAAPIQKAAPLVLEYVLYSLTQTMDARSVPFPIRRLFSGPSAPSAGGDGYAGAPPGGNGPPDPNRPPPPGQSPR